MNLSNITILTANSLGPSKLRLLFNNGIQKTINMEPILYSELFGPLRDVDLFAEVSLNPETHTIEWPNGADFHPETLYNWEIYRDELSRQNRNAQIP